MAYYFVDENQRYPQVVEEWSGSSVLKYTYGDDLISQNWDGTLSYYYYDGNLSTRQLGQFHPVLGWFTDSYTYDAFGNLVASTNSIPNNYLYTGEQYDPNAGFYYLRARYYNPQVGRFLTRDTTMDGSGTPLV